MTTGPEGTSLRLHLRACRCDPRLLREHALLAPAVRACIEASGCAALAVAGHDFDGGGCTLCWVLAESHVAVHSWPELDDTVLVELSVCDHLRSNRERARDLADRLVALFAPEREGRQELAMMPPLPEETP